MYPNVSSRRHPQTSADIQLAEVADPPDQRSAFYREMYLIRRVETTLLELFAQGAITGTVHTSLGQEACAVGVVNALRREQDVLFSNHRAHGHFLSYCDDAEGLIAEIMGRRTGVCGGVGGSQNLHVRNLYTGGIQGGMVPVAVGAALAERHKRTDAIVTLFLGDGTMGEGTVYEGLNVSSLWSLPLLFVLEDNQYAQSTPKSRAHAGNIASRADTFEIKSAHLHVEDVYQVYEAAQEAVSYVRGQGKPFFLTLETYRLGPHSKGDDHRDPAEIAAYRERDPLTRLARMLSLAERQLLEEEIDARVQQAVTAAQASEAQDVQRWREHQAWSHPSPI